MANLNGNKNNKNNQDPKISLKIAETDPRFVGKGMALVDPEVMEEVQLKPGDVIEVISKKNRRTYVLLWSSPPSDYGKGLIRVDEYTSFLRPPMSSYVILGITPFDVSFEMELMINSVN